MIKSNSFKTAFLLLANALLLSFCTNTVEQPEVKLTALTGLERIQQDEPLIGTSIAYIKAAKNEVESFQVVIGAIQKISRLLMLKCLILPVMPALLAKKISLFTGKNISGYVAPHCGLSCLPAFTPILLCRSLIRLPENQ